MLKTWSTTSDNPSWRTLTDALRSQSVGATQLAGDLEAKYCPVEGNDVKKGIGLILTAELRLMSDSVFTLLVKSPTTDQGSLIDHVYYRNPSRNITVEVQDTYFSDHDTVYCSIPFSEI